MDFYVYILYSEKTNQFYKGQTDNVKNRLKRHNAGKENFTSKGRPWVLLWFCQKKSRKEALALEKKLKNMSRKKLIAFMKKYNNDIAGPDALILLNQWSGC